jgi:hypothetical protein
MWINAEFATNQEHFDGLLLENVCLFSKLKKILIEKEASFRDEKVTVAWKIFCGLQKTSYKDKIVPRQHF